MAVKSLQGRINSFFFYELMKDPQKVLDWCTKAGLVTQQYVCPKCNEPMRLTVRKDIGDGFMWRCRSKGSENLHNTSRSVRKGSIFEKSSLSIGQILLLTWYWVNELRLECVQNEMNLSNVTVGEWYCLCREVCLSIVMEFPGMIGGAERVVEIEEFRFGKVKFYRKKVEGEWVVGGLEKHTDKSFFEVVPERSREALLAVIRKRILPGTTLVSDCWTSYECEPNEEVLLMDGAESVTLRAPEEKRRLSESYFGGAWCAAKRAIHSNGHVKDSLDGYLAESIWRRQNSGEVQRVFLAFCSVVKATYPPFSKDV